MYMHGVKDKIVARIKGHGMGYAFTNKELLDLGERRSVDKALSLLVQEGLIRRLGRGLYDYPRNNPELGGRLSPDLDQVARALGRKLGVRIQPHGAWAANLLGLSEQVPAQLVYLTDGHPKTYRFGKQAIVFRRTAPGKFRSGDELVGLIAGALRELGPNAVTDELRGRLRRLLADRNPGKVSRDTQYLNGWIAELIQGALPAGKTGERQ